MSLHNEIMNIQAAIVLDGPEGVGNVSQNRYTAYKEGHRDARNAAAELALKYDEIASILKEFVEFDAEANGGLSLLDHHDLWDRAEKALKALK